jgi:membrane fusion protein (multidrug efflux system)
MSGGLINAAGRRLLFEALAGSQVMRCAGPRRDVCLSIGSSLVIALICGVAPSLAQTTVPVVSVMPVPMSDASPSTEFNGRVEAKNGVDIRARVDGFLEKRLFNEGQFVNDGQHLFSIERTTLEIALAAAQARLGGAKATLQDTEGRLERNQRLRQTDAVAQATLEEVTAARDNARAAEQLAQTDVRQAELNLGYTIIKAPIAGRIGRANFSIGSLIGPSSTALARVVQTDPIRVVFSVSDRAILQLRAGAMDQSPEELAKRFIPTLRMPSGEDYAETGVIEFVGNEFDPRTGTLPVWAQFPNTKSLLVPGQFLTVIVRTANIAKRPVVPVNVVEQDRDGRYVLLVDDADKVAIQRIQVGNQIGQNWIVDSGLKGGERLIVDGMTNARPGSVVRSIPSSAWAGEAAKTAPKP